MTTTLLLDADIIAFKLAATSQASFQFPGCEPSVSVDEWDDVVPRIDAEVAKLTAQLKADAVIVCLSCPTEENFRLDILPTYKGNRDYSKRPVYLGRIKDHLEANYPSYHRPRLEADDILGILSTHPTLVKGRKVIVSEDKDLKTIPGWLFNPSKDTKPRLISEAEANHWHFTQTLTGDPTDCYVGCPGIGQVRAARILATSWGWDTVVETFESRGLTEEDALVQARVARICRASDYDFKRKEVILWTP